MGDVASHILHNTFYILVEVKYAHTYFHKYTHYILHITQYIIYREWMGFGLIYVI
jgi:hypothetical protein